jgi:tRNA dimethylallyltransferase
MMRWLVAIVGPTAVGKSRLALALAQTLGGEIVSADSRQVYRYMDIGTAKPGPAERALVPHHLIDIIDPDQDFSLALYQKLAYQAIRDIQGRGKLPFLVGGSGLYVWSVVEGWQIPQVPPDPKLRGGLEARAAREGIASLYGELKALDPVAASRLDPRNVRRVIRALEVCRSTGVAFSRLQQKKPLFPTLLVGLTTEREDLYHRIDSRIDAMIEKGLVEEVRGLAGKGYGFDLPSMSGIGYRQIGMYLRGEMGLEAAIEQIKFESHRFARHQYAWFKLGDGRIHWFQAAQCSPGKVADLITSKVSSP